VLENKRAIEEAVAERASKPSDAMLQQAYEILGEDAETAQVEELIAVQAETLGE
jgi:hypothetical protein